MREHFVNYEKKIAERLDQEAEEIRRAIDGDPEVSEIRAGERLDAKVYGAVDAFEEAVAKRDRLGAPEGDPEEAAAGESFRSYAGLSEKDREALRLGWEVQEQKEGRKSGRRNGRRRSTGGRSGGWKRVAAVLLICLMVGGIGVTSAGGPKKAVELARQVVGDRELSEIDNSSNEVKQIGNNEEAEAYQQIKEELNIEPVRLRRISGEMKYKLCEVDQEIRTAQLIYEYKDINMSYLISDTHGEGLWITDLEDEGTDQYPYTNGKLTAEIIEHESPEYAEKKYTAEFAYEGIYYQLTGIMKWEEFEEILKNLHFPS